MKHCYWPKIHGYHKPDDLLRVEERKCVRIEGTYE